MRDSVTVLHVDDDEEFAALTGTYLEAAERSLDVTTVHTPDAALERLAADPVDCVVTDFDMGSSDGIELVAKIRERAPELPVILFTARNNEALIERALEAGATEYLQKGRPAQFTLLAHRIHTAIAVRASDEAADAADPAAADEADTGEECADGGIAVTSNAAATPEPRTDRPDAVRPPDERIEELASVVSHDLQNPLTIAQGYLDRARASGDEECFGHVEDALSEIREISEGVVAMARLGKRVESPESVDVESLALSCWQELEAPDAELVLEEVEDVAARRKHLRAFFERVFENAVVHGPSDVTVRVALDDRGLRVADDGPGVDPDRREQVLEAGHSTVQGRPGLGLSIARAVAEAHGWKLVLAESEAGGLSVECRGAAPVDRS